MNYFDRTILKELNGYSGMKTELFSSSRQQDLFVRKTAYRHEQMARLKRQCSKQIAAFKNGILTPRVHKIEKRKHSFSFEMDYIPGLSAGSALIHQRHAIIPKLLSAIKDLLSAYNQKSDSFIDPSAFLRKIEKVRTLALENPFCLKHEQLIAIIFDRLLLSDWTRYPASPCHGDLSLENIIINDEKIFFIDFDVPDISSLYLDLAKLFQDLIGYWFLRTIRNDPLTFNNAINALGTLKKEVILLAHDFGMTNDNIISGTIFNLFRILPYVKSENDAHFLLTNIMNIYSSRHLMRLH